MEKQLGSSTLNLRQMLMSEYEELGHSEKEKIMEQLSERIKYLKNLKKSFLISTKTLIYEIQNHYNEIIRSVSKENNNFERVRDLIHSNSKINKIDKKAFLEEFRPDMNSLIEWHEEKFKNIEESIKDYYNIDIFNISLKPKNDIITQNPINIILGIDSTEARITPSIYTPPQLLSLSTGSYRLEDSNYVYYSIWHQKDLGDIYLYNNDTKGKTPLIKSQTSCEPSLTFCIFGSKWYTETYLSKECNLCKRAVKEFYQCSFCQSEVCKKCTEWIFNSKISDSGLKCFNNHPLRVFENAGEFYMDIREKKDGSFLCDGCERRKFNKSHHCRKCLVDYCEDCIDTILSTINYFDKHKPSTTLAIRSSFIFKNYCCKKLQWNYSKFKYRCSQCYRTFKKTGAFECKDCLLVVCLECTSYCVKQSQ